MNHLTSKLYLGGSLKQYRELHDPRRADAQPFLNREIQTNWSNDAPDITRSFDDASLSKKTWPVAGIIPPHWEEVGIYVVD